MLDQDFNEYAIEGGKPVDLDRLKAARMGQEDYEKYHRHGVIPCHDVFIKHSDRILLVKRKSHPAKGHIWPIGGRLQRGVSAEDSLREKAHEESGLYLEKLRLIGFERTFFKTDPFGHNGGTDTINLVYFAEGNGTLKLNDLHEKPLLVTRENYLPLRERLHPYVIEYMDVLWSNRDPSLDLSKVLGRQWEVNPPK